MFKADTLSMPALNFPRANCFSASDIIDHVIKKLRLTNIIYFFLLIYPIKHTLHSTDMCLVLTHWSPDWDVI